MIRETQTKSIAPDHAQTSLTATRQPLRWMFRLLMIVLCALASMLSLTACASKAQTGALIGAGAGAATGYIIGNEMDKSDNRHHHHHHD